MTHYNRKLGALKAKWVVSHLANLSWRAVLVAIIVVGGLIGSPADNALANQANPDATPTADKYIYRNILETGDMAVFIYANIPYSSTPTALVTESFIWRLIDTDNTTEIGSTTGYAYNDKGYGYNVFWLYFAAADAPAWAGAYVIRLSGNPAIFSSPPTYNFPVNISDYSSMTAPADVKVEIANRILITSADLNVRWGLTATTSLLLEIEAGTVLSIYGENVFRGVILGCQAIAPSVFRFNASEIVASNRSFGSGYSSNISGQWAGTWIGDAQQGGADFFGTGYDLMSIILIVIICVVLLVLQTKISNNIWSAFIDISILLIVAARLSLGLGDDGMAFMALTAALFWVYDSAKTWGLIGR